MKEIFSENYALIGDRGIAHPSYIYTDDNVEVVTADTEEELNYIISQREPASFPDLPEEGQEVEGLKCYKYGDVIVKCLQSHTRMHYSPEDTPALFLVITPTGSDYPVWVQPTGGHDAYNIGDRVRYPDAEGNVYESLINANTWSPEAYPAGWQLI